MACGSWSSVPFSSSATCAQVYCCCTVRLSIYSQQRRARSQGKHFLAGPAIQRFGAQAWFAVSNTAAVFMFAITAVAWNFWILYVSRYA